jgi:hypothetical protein
MDILERSANQKTSAGGVSKHAKWIVLRQTKGFEDLDGVFSVYPRTFDERRQGLIVSTSCD